MEQQSKQNRKIFLYQMILKLIFEMQFSIWLIRLPLANSQWSPSPIKKGTSPIQIYFKPILRPSTLCFSSPVLCSTETESRGGSRAGAGKPSKGLSKQTAKQRRRSKTLQKLKDARKNKRKQETYAAKRVQQLQKIRIKRITFVGKLQRALESGNFTNVLNGPIQNVSSFQLAKVSKQATCLLLYYKMSVEGPPKLKTFIFWDEQTNAFLHIC